VVAGRQAVARSIRSLEVNVSRELIRLMTQYEIFSETRKSAGPPVNGIPANPQELPHRSGRTTGGLVDD
jgi:hypothetical protein